MKTELETTKSENIALEGQTQNIDPNAPSSVGGITQNMQIWVHQEQHFKHRFQKDKD